MAGGIVSGQARVVDGDTLDVAGERIRLHGIDAPELDQTCGAPQSDWACGIRARDEARRLIGAGEVRCTGIERDRYGRLVAACAVGSTDLGAAMVEAGLAMAFERYSRAYVPHEGRARAAGRGIWAHGVDTLVPPAQWRRGQLPAAAVGATDDARTASAGCEIKGNISANGSIYHLPGQRDYDRTVIDTRRGERWFCSESEARAAGWRRARQ